MKRIDDTIQRVTDNDRCRLGQLLDRDDSPAWGSRYCRGELEALLEQAEPVEAHVAPAGLVTMNSRVRLFDPSSGEVRTVTLVYPDDVDVTSDGISILEPLGTALLGCNEGDVIQCPAGERRRRFRIDEVVHQPEQASAFHL